MANLNNDADTFARPLETKEDPVLENPNEITELQPATVIRDTPNTKKSLAQKLGIGGFGGFYMLLFYGAAGGGLTAYYAPKKKLLFGIGGGIATMYLISYAIRAVDNKDYNPIPTWIRGKKKLDDPSSTLNMPIAETAPISDWNI